MSKKAKRGGTKAYRFMYAVFAGIVSFIFNYKVINPENEPDKAGCIVCANHVSAIDAIALCCAFKKNQVNFMAKKELFKVPVLAPLIKMLGAFPIDRGGNDSERTRHRNRDRSDRHRSHPRLHRLRRLPQKRR